MSFIAKNEKCVACGKAVYAMELIKADDKPFHKTCIKCAQCNCTLKLGNYAALGGRFYCKPHFKQLFALKGNYHGGFADGAAAGFVSGPQAGGASPGLGDSGQASPAPSSPAPTTTHTPAPASPAPATTTPTPTPAPVSAPKPAPSPLKQSSETPAPSWTSAGPSESERKQLDEQKKKLADDKKQLEEEKKAAKAEQDKSNNEVAALKKAIADAKAAAAAAAAPAPVAKEAPAPVATGLSPAEEALAAAFAALLADPQKKALALARAKLG